MGEAGRLEHCEQPLVVVGAVALLEDGARDALRRILRVQVEWAPFDPRAEPALEPRGPIEADVAEGSYVVGPHGDPRRLRHRGPAYASASRSPRTRAGRTPPAPWPAARRRRRRGSRRRLRAP